MGGGEREREDFYPFKATTASVLVATLSPMAASSSWEWGSVCVRLGRCVWFWGTWCAWKAPSLLLGSVAQCVFFHEGEPAL